MHVDWYSRGVYLINARGYKKPVSNTLSRIKRYSTIIYEGTTSSTQYGNGVFAKILIFELFFVS